MKNKILVIVVVLAIVLLIGSYIAWSKVNRSIPSVNTNINHQVEVNSTNITKQQDTKSSETQNVPATPTVNQCYKFIGQITEDLGPKEVGGISQEFFSVKVRQELNGTLPETIILSDLNCKSHFSTGNLYNITATHDVVNQRYVCSNATNFPIQSGGNQ